VPLGLRSDVGRVQGRLLDEHGHGIEGVIISLSGQVVRTQSDGSYCFWAVPVGERLLSIAPEEIGADRVASPFMPFRVRVAAGETIEQDLRLLPVARLHGSIRLLPPPSEGVQNGVAFGEPSRPQVDADVLKGMVIELRNGSQTHRRFIQNGNNNGSHNGADFNGTHFQFNDLTPGAWQIVVHRNGLPDAYEIRVEAETVHLEPGENRHITIDVVPKTRPIILFDNGNGDDVLSIVSPKQ
jgi:hypothetical protein